MESHAHELINEDGPTLLSMCLLNPNYEDAESDIYVQIIIIIILAKVIIYGVAPS